MKPYIDYLVQRTAFFDSHTTACKKENTVNFSKYQALTSIQRRWWKVANSASRVSVVSVENLTVHTLSTIPSGVNKI